MAAVALSVAASLFMAPRLDAPASNPVQTPASATSATEERSGMRRLKVRAHSFLLSNFRERDPANLLVKLHAFGSSYQGVRRGWHGPFFFSEDGRAFLPQPAVHAITELPPGMTWIGDETIIVMIVSGQYAKVITSKGILYGGFSKNCFFASALLHEPLKCEWDVLRGKVFGFPLLFEILGEKVPDFLQRNAVDAIIAGPRTYHDTKQILATVPALRDCLETAIDIESVLVLLSKRC
jgi:hypothetical protein